jgi:hypothetical protein
MRHTSSSSSRPSAAADFGVWNMDSLFIEHVRQFQQRSV